MGTTKIVKVCIVLLIALLMVSTISFADYTPNQFKSKINTSGTGATKVKDTGGKIVGIIQVIGTIVAVGMAMVVGIKYMMGSAEERAEYKKIMLPYLVGATLLFAAANLTQVIYTWASNL